MFILGPTEGRAGGPMSTEAMFHEQRRQRLESFEEDSGVEEQTQRAYVDHYHDKPANFDHQRSAGTDDGERWFNQHAFNIHHSPNDIRKSFLYILHLFL